VIAVDGPSGAGKTTLAARLVDVLRGSGAAVTSVSMDDLYPGWDGLEPGVDRLVADVLRPYAAGSDRLELRRWDWSAAGLGAPEPVPCGDALVVEGVGCGARRCAPWIAVLVWLDADEDVRRARVLARDGGTFAPHWDAWAASESAHFDREGTRGRADVVLAVP
jgi:hypothetical protein